MQRKRWGTENRDREQRQRIERENEERDSSCLTTRLRLIGLNDTNQFSDGAPSLGNRLVEFLLQSERRVVADVNGSLVQISYQRMHC